MKPGTNAQDRSDSPDADADAQTHASAEADVDVVVVGAGFAGLYLIHKLTAAGFAVAAFEQGEDVGGTWYWNRYPGARCDIQCLDYAFSFDPELERAWTWSEKYATQPEILRYLCFVADRYDLRKHISFGVRVDAARWCESGKYWTVGTSQQAAVKCKYYVLATGCLSTPKLPDIEGVGQFRGRILNTGRWPREEVDFRGKAVAVIGTGSSGIQAIPKIAEQAAQLVVFQRTANFSFPARNGDPSPERLTALRSNRDQYREETRWSAGGVPLKKTQQFSWDLTQEQRRERFEKAWSMGDFIYMQTQLWADQGNDFEGNALVAEFIRDKIRATVDDPATAERLVPRGYPYGAKRPCLDTNYYETFNRSNVSLVDLNSEPIDVITHDGVRTSVRDYKADIIVFATGFDAMTGTVLAIHPITGRHGRTLADAWTSGPETYLGLTVAGFPNLFLITGPGSPSVLSNMVISIEQHVDWVVECLTSMRQRGFDAIEATTKAQDGWRRHLADCAHLTLHRHARTWYTGANVPGKAQGVMPYTGGVGAYREICNEVVSRGMLGFSLSGRGVATQCNDGEVVRLQPDVRMHLGMLAKTNGVPLELRGVRGAREFVDLMVRNGPSGRPVGEVTTATMQIGGCRLPYRLYRPATGGPHRTVVYFHGGGWVVGSEESDDLFCRDLCRRADMLVVSVGYRRAPEHRFPIAAEDGHAAVSWVASHLPDLGGLRAPVLVAGWSAGATVAAVTCQMARDREGPAIAGQVLVCPVTDGVTFRESHESCGNGFQLTRSALSWFWDQYCPADQRRDPRASPLYGMLSHLPPCLVVTAEFDPLRDEGAALASAMRVAGTQVQHIDAPGHFHFSFTMVDTIITAVRYREEIAHALRGFAKINAGPPVS